MERGITEVAKEIECLNTLIKECEMSLQSDKKVENALQWLLGQKNGMLMDIVESVNSMLEKKA